MSGRVVKLVVLFFVFLAISNSSYTVGAKLAQGEYGVTNGSFEDSNSMAGSGWSQWTAGGNDSITINTDSSKAYYGNNSVKVYRDTGNAVIYQQIDVVTSGAGPKVGDTVEAGVWVMFDAAAAGDDGQVVIQVKYVVGGTKTPITTSYYIPNKQANKWYYILTQTDELSNGKKIPSGAEKIEIVVDSWLDGTVYVDFAQAGIIGSITGNPSKLAMVEYQTWFGIPDYLPDPRRFTDPGYDGFASYEPHEWEHWEWGWDPDGGYNSDPGFYKQIGIQNGHIFSIVNDGFEGTGYGTGATDWRKYTSSGGTNARTNEKAYEGSYSVKFTNPAAGADECSMWQWIPCYEWNSSTDSNVPNEKERIYTSAMLNFGDVNFVGGNFWVQIRAYHDTDPGPEENNVWDLISKSYEHISPEYVEQNKDANGWVQITSQPVQKSVIPWQTHGLQIAIKFWYAGTIYIDKVEIGEAEFSNISRKTACAKSPITGPYESTNDDLIDYHLDLCAAMQLDAMLVNYYGHQYSQENYQKVAFEKMAQKVDDRDMKICAFYEPKVHLKEWGDANYYADMNDMNDISDMNAADTAKVNAYIDDVTNYNSISEMNDINDVKHYIKMAAIQDDIKYVLDTWGNKKCYLTYRSKSVMAIFGIYSSKYDDGMEYQDWADLYANLTEHDYSYNFIFIGDAIPNDWPDLSGWFDAFTGMMNWYLVDDIVRDRMYPTQQDVYERSRDVVNQSAVNWAGDGAGRFAIGVTYPQFNDEGVGAWGPIDGKYYVNRTPTWSGNFYKKNNEGLIYHTNDIDWFVIATFNDWNEGSTIEPSIEDGYLYPILTQEFIEDFKGIADEPNNLMQQITEKYINTRVKMDVGTGIEKAGIDPTGYNTYYKLSIYQFDSSGGYLGELMLLDWSPSAGTFTDDFAGHHANLAQYEPCIRISATSGGGWIKVDQLSEGGWTEDFSDVSDWSSFEGVSITSDGALALIKDAVDGSGGAQWTGARVAYTSGDVISLDVNSVYDGTGIYYGGAACLKTLLNYEGFNTYTQDQIHTYAVSQNVVADQNVIDPTGMYKALNHYEILSSYNFAAQKNTSVSDAYHSICYWMSYDVPNVSPRPEKMPAIIPLNGNYRDWVVVNGYSTTDNPRTAGSYTVNGFWLTDPDANGIGKNVYTTASALESSYSAISSSDTYNGYYVSIVEPPAASKAKVTIAKLKAYPGYTGSRKSIIAAAIKGLEDNDLKENRKFKSAFSKTKAGRPILVNDGSDCYYIVPFVKDKGCSVAVIIDAKNGAFRQAAYSNTPDSKYLGRFNKQARAKFKSGKSSHRKGKNAFLPNVNDIVDSR